MNITDFLNGILVLLIIVDVVVLLGMLVLSLRSKHICYDCPFNRIAHGLKGEDVYK